MNSSTPLSREEIAKREIGVTDIAPWLARAMTIGFLALVFAVPLLHELTASNVEQGGQPAPTWPRCAAIFTRLPDVAAAFDRSKGDLWQRTLAANHNLLKSVDVYETGLKDESRLVERLLGPTQHALTKWGRLGNEKAYLGRDGWLFYRPSVDYVTGPGFLDPRVLAKRAQSGKAYAAPAQPDPRPAIIQFAHDLARRDITLILVPAPGKATVQPERLSSRYAAVGGALHNASFEQFKHDVEREGVIVFDPAPLLRENWLRTDDDQFLKTDTHWTCQAAQTVAETLRGLIEERSLLPPRPATQYRVRSRFASNLGDIAVMLRLPDDQALFSSETVKIRRVFNGDEPWQPDSSADVLLLGDSFTNIFSQEAMKWGASAGLAEQLSYALQRPIDRISQNDSGAFATRQTLAQELARGHDRLAGKRLVVWEFAARELAVGDWKMIPLAQLEGGQHPLPPGEGAKPDLFSKDGGMIVVQAMVESTAGVPKPGSVPYRDAVTSLHLTGVKATKGESPADQVVVYVLGMQNNRWTTAAQYKPGDTVSLTVQPWESVSGKYGSLTRIELDDPDFKLIDLPLFWGEPTP